MSKEHLWRRDSGRFQNSELTTHNSVPFPFSPDPGARHLRASVGHLRSIDTIRGGANIAQVCKPGVGSSDCAGVLRTLPGSRLRGGGRMSAEKGRNSMTNRRLTSFSLVAGVVLLLGLLTSAAPSALAGTIGPSCSGGCLGAIYSMTYTTGATVGADTTSQSPSPLTPSQINPCSYQT